MILYPAIDLRGGRVVRLSQGDYDRMTVYDQSPIEVVKGFISAGATHLHTVDLDGAKDGNPQNRDCIAKLCTQGLFVEVGGGMRCEADVERTLALGANRVILGTLAISNFELVGKLAKAHPGKIAVGVDTKDGYIATHGWLEVSDVSGIEFCKKLLDIGVDTVIYTDIAKDGQLQGTNLSAYEALSRINGLNIIASGGISYEHELTALDEMGIHGAILGKALYAGRIDLKKVIKLVETR